MVQIKFNNGQTIEAELNGNCYIVDKKPEFPKDLTNIQASDEFIQNGEIVECYSIDGRYWFGIHEIPQYVLWQASIEDALCDLSREV